MAATGIPVSTLDFSIESWSSHSASYHPNHIKVNKPQDQSSRLNVEWSSGSNNQMQFIILKLEKLSIVQTITFGKYHKVHVCNLKEFKVFGGLELGNMTELLHCGLRNDSEPETFQLRFMANGVTKELLGIIPKRSSTDGYGVGTSFVDGIASATGFLLLIQVIDGNFDGAEDLMSQALDKNLFEDYISELVYKPKWNKITSSNLPSPTMRGGHQMCIDSDSGIIYLFGGWDGTRDLADFWAFKEEDRQWHCISMDTRKQGGPEPRSCHKICFDKKSKVIYTFGKYVDPDSRPNIQLDSDFWKYDIVESKWTKISSNTAQEGGPDLIYDHQMLVDPERQVLYVFGGRAISPDPTQITYSGLYSWDITNNRWRLIRSDNPSPDSSIQMKSRIGHSMLFNDETREIYIFAGQRHKDFLADFYIYQIDTDTIVEVSRDYSKSGGPDAGFTQRATIDVGMGEFYVLSGLMREKNSLSETKNAFWVYSIKKNRWLKVYENENVGSDYWSQMGQQEPRPRFAHQLVYNPERKCQYLFGGNPGESNHPNVRLDDFWELFLTRPTAEDVLRKAQFQIRKQRFIELCATSEKKTALHYLQSQVSQVVNHENPEESKDFRQLVLFLFSWNPVKPANIPGTAEAIGASGGMAIDENGTQEIFPARIALYEALLSYFPELMREPKLNLVDLIPMV